MPDPKREEVEIYISSILEEMESDKFDVEMEKDLRDKYLEESKDFEEYMCIKFFYELFRAIDITTMYYLNDKNVEDIVFEIASDMSFIGSDRLKDLYFNKYTEITNRLIDKEII